MVDAIKLNGALIDGMVGHHEHIENKMLGVECHSQIDHVEIDFNVKNLGLVGNLLATFD